MYVNLTLTSSYGQILMFVYLADATYTNTSDEVYSDPNEIIDGISHQAKAQPPMLRPFHPPPSAPPSSDHAPPVPPRKGLSSSVSADQSEHHPYLKLDPSPGKYSASVLASNLIR